MREGDRGLRAVPLWRDELVAVILVARITDAFMDVCGAPAESVHVWFQEVSREDYAFSGKLVADK